MAFILEFLTGFILLQVLKCQDEDNCLHQRSCDDCMLVSAQCRWCSAENYAYERCDTEANLLAKQCSQNAIINEETDIELELYDETKPYEIQPKSVKARYRKDSSFKFTIDVTRLYALPSEVVLIMDFSTEMKPVLDQVKNLTPSIFNDLSPWDVKKIGYAKFKDKLSHPISNISGFDPTQIKPDSPFNFGVIASLSDDTTYLGNELLEETVSAKMDIPESALDAVVQTVDCSQIGWSGSDDIGKTIVVITDEDTKLQTDAKIVGVIKPHDMVCHADENGMDQYGMGFDYPSVGQIGDLLQYTKTEVIFAVSPRVKPNYEEITKAWLGVNYAVKELDTANFDLIEILTEAREEIDSKVTLTYDKTPDLRVTITPLCPTFTGTECTSVKLNEKVQFEVNVDILNPNSVSQINFYVSAYGVITLYYEPITQCKCSKNSTTSGLCENGGEFMCGTCKCVDPFIGNKCECKESATEHQSLCTNPYTGTVCTNRGTCDPCGVCICDMALWGLPYSGKYCQCGKSECVPYEGLLCGGPERGICGCETCECNEQYTGEACEEIKCGTEDMFKACTAKGDNVTCSNVGTCICGECICPADKAGKYCEEKSNLTTCADFEDAVSCYLSNETINGDVSCNASNATIEEVSGDTYQCVRLDNNNCQIYYNYTIYETNVTLKIKKIDTETDCVEVMETWVVSLTVFGVSLLVGLIIVALYYAGVYLYYRSKKKHFTEEEEEKKAFV